MAAWISKPGYQIVIAILLVCPVFILGCANPPPKPVNGLEVVEYDNDGYIQAAPGIDWSRYKHFQLEKAAVEFRENWARDLKRRDGTIIRESDAERIKSEVSKSFNKVFSRELSGAGWGMTEDDGVDVLRFTPRIVDLDIYAPDRVRDYIGGALADSKGRVTIEMDIHDSTTDRLIATTRQHQEDPYDGYMERANSVTNHNAFRLMLQRWSGWLLDWLNDAQTRKLN